MHADTKALIARLNPACKKALESAAALCVSKTHYNVELAHFLLRLLESEGCDIPLALQYYNLDIVAIKKQLLAALEKFQAGNTTQTVLSSHIITVLEEAWMVTSLKLGENGIRSGAILMAMLESASLRGIIMENCPLLLKLPYENYWENLRELSADSAESKQQPHDTVAAGAPDPLSPDPAASAGALTRFTIDMTGQARQGRLDPVYGRDLEVRQLIDVLSRRRQNNPILVGEAGVGKTAVVEGLAQRIIAGDVPPSLKNISLKLLDVGLLQAGASMKGEFEDRLKSLLEEVKASPTPIILFIDEAHTLIGAGGAAGLGDAANLLKPALARGEIRTIAATTWAEYKRHIEKDAALTRRFEVVKVDEPSPEKALGMLRALAGSLARHHHVTILDEALQAAVSLSHRFLTGRRLPDKAVSVLDTACAQFALMHSAIPQPLEEARNQLVLLEIEKEMLLREEFEAKGHGQRLNDMAAQIGALTQEVDSLSKGWKASGAIIQKIQELREQLGAFPVEDLSSPEPQGLRARIQEMENSLKEEENSARISVPSGVNRESVAKVIAGWTGIPLETMTRFEEGLTIQQLQEFLQQRIVGQSHAINRIARQVVSYRAGLSDPDKPMGVFMLVGPSGVGKTETAQALAEILNGHGRHLIRINMSEFQEAHTVATLKGAPPGYVGYGKGGTLTEAVRRNPYSVILLDEVEKAHPDVMEIFYQVFDKGMIEDSEGVEVNFRNSLIILTSNIGSEVFANPNYNELAKNLPEDSQSGQGVNPQLMAEIHAQLEKHFPHAFLARLTVIPYLPLSSEELSRIVQLKLQEVARRLQLAHHVNLIYDGQDVAAIAAQCIDTHQGARAIDHILTQKILPDLSERILEKRDEAIKELRLRE